MSENKEYQLACTYVKGYYVSTMYRQTSAALAPDIRYFETLVREWDKETKERGAMVYQAEKTPYSEAAAIAEHNSIVEYIVSGKTLSQRDYID